MRQTMNALIATLVCVLFLSNAVRADNKGEGSADFCERHGCGQTECTPCPQPPLPPPCVCPDVTCEATDCSKTTVTVNPTPCPEYEVKFPNYVPCRKRKDGSLKCPRPKTPRRVLAPIGQ